MREGLSTPNVNGGRSNSSTSKFQKPLPLKGPHNLIRLLPAPSKYMTNGAWFDRQAQHFGYAVPNKKDESKPFPRPFACVKEQKWDDNKAAFVVTARCPECDKIDQVKTALLAAQAKYKDAEIDQKREATKIPIEWLKKHNLDVKTVVYAMNDKREVGYVRLPINAFKKIRDLVKKLQEQKVDPFDVDGGVWFDVTREGEGFTTKYDAFIVYDEVERDGEVLQKRRTAKMSEDEINKAINEQVDITKLLIEIPHEAVMRLVKSTTVEEAGAIFGIAQKVEEPSEESETDDSNVPGTPVVTMPPPAVSETLTDAKLKELFNL